MTRPFDASRAAASAWDWGMLRGCFPGTRISPGDIDGVVERNGRVLFLEGKKGPYRPLSRGQEIMYRVLARTNTVLVFWGSPPSGPWTRVVALGALSGEDIDLGDDLRRAVGQWFAYADRGIWEERA